MENQTITDIDRYDDQTSFPSRVLKDGKRYIRAFHIIKIAKKVTLSSFNVALELLGFSPISTIYDYIPVDFIHKADTYEALKHFCTKNGYTINNFAIEKVGSQYMAKPFAGMFDKKVPLWFIFLRTHVDIIDDVRIYYFTKVDNETGEVFLSADFLLSAKLERDCPMPIDKKIKLPIKTYLMLDHNTGLYKIGKSNNPVYREKTLQSEKPTIEMLFVIDSNIESELHKKYSDKRVRGEWFRLSEAEVEEIAQEAFKVN